jgi:hypothetical protein
LLVMLRLQLAHIWFNHALQSLNEACKAYLGLGMQSN